MGRSGNEGQARPESALWPAPLGDAAFRGLVGEVVGTVLPHTEADAAALLIQFLVAYGNCVGRQASVSLDGRRHHRLNLCAVVVGESRKAHADAAMEEVRRLFFAADPRWAAERVQTGLASGEGLIAAVRDPAGESDAGVEDKRLLAVQPDFAQLLRKNSRAGNGLAEVLQRFFHGEPRVQAMTRAKPLAATEAHVSLIAHCTTPDLRSVRTSVSLAGYAGCLLWVCARRSKLLPEGSALSSGEETRLHEALGRSLARAAEAGAPIGMDAEARERWRALYAAAESDESGAGWGEQGGTLLLRLAGIYAAAEGSATVRREHLRAAEEVWRYVGESSRYLFGAAGAEAFSAPVEKLERKVYRLVAAYGNGLTRRDLMDQTGRNYSAGALQEALDALKDKGYLRDEAEEGTPQRGARWFTVPSCQLSDS
jgi:hypothetical protein